MYIHLDNSSILIILNIQYKFWIDLEYGNLENGLSGGDF